MNCITCNKPMVVLELQEVEIDHCLSCGGIWLDAGEIELLLNSSEADRLLVQLQDWPNSRVGKRRCPICLKKMVIITLGQTDEVTVDRCRKNHGLWFDKGELKTVFTIFDTDKHRSVSGLLKDMFEL